MHNVKKIQSAYQLFKTAKRSAEQSKVAGASVSQVKVINLLLMLQSVLLPITAWAHNKHIFLHKIFTDLNYA
jgi:hypothetical protein